MRWVLCGAMLLVAGCSGRDGLREEHARATAEALIAANGPRIRDFHRLEWKSLKHVSGTEARGAAVMVYQFRLPNGATGEEHIPGTFVYHRRPGQGWVLDHVDFPNPNSLYHRLDQDVFVKVTSAEVAPAAVAGQIPAPAAGGAPPETTEPTAAAPPPSRDGRGMATGSGAPPSTSSAHRAVLGYLASNPPGYGTWSAGSFQPIRAVGGDELELPAVLLVRSADDTLQYRGGFYFDYDPDAGKWMLRRLSFRSPGSEPIEEDVVATVPVE